MCSYWLTSARVSRQCVLLDWKSNRNSFKHVVRCWFEFPNWQSTVLLFGDRLILLEQRGPLDCQTQRGLKTMCYFDIDRFRVPKHCDASDWQIDQPLIWSWFQFFLDLNSFWFWGNSDSSWMNWRPMRTESVIHLLLDFDWIGTALLLVEDWSKMELIWDNCGMHFWDYSGPDRLLFEYGVEHNQTTYSGAKPGCPKLPYRL